MKKFFTLALAAFLGLMAVMSAGCGEKTASPAKEADKRLTIYTSMKESLIGGIVAGFQQKYPNIAVDYQSAGAGKLMEKIAAERQSGRILADVIWTSEVPDFYQMKEEGLLEPFRPSNFDELVNPFEDYDGSFTAARLGTLGIVINMDKVKTPPISWDDIATQEAYKNSFGIADPALSGTSFMSIALLEKEFGWSYIERLQANGAVKSKGSGQVVDLTAAGDLSACLGVDYITASRIDKGAPLVMVYPRELLMVPSPIAIFKGSTQMEAAKLFVDYVMTQEAQQKVAESGTVPVRRDVTIPNQYDLPTPDEAMNQGIKIDYAEVLAHKAETIEKFSQLFK
ncbi:MAG: ABC transporter substrate-binding protein [Selenomonadaceae bacterium]|nr:ABC transporter substrate-binding protein [Selenomonadaceae bacterium]